MALDLLIKNGRVIDPSEKINDLLDVAITGGKIVAVEQNLDPTEAYHTIDATDLIVVPGLVDFHAHAFAAAVDLGPDLDEACESSGVTTFVDAGSTGAATFNGFKTFIVENSQTRLYAFIHISSIGLMDLEVGESTYLDLHNVERAANLAKNYPDLILGIKVRVEKNAVGVNGLEPLMLAKKAADLAGRLPVMVHVTDCVVPISKVLALLEQGDIVSHIFHGRDNGMLDKNGEVFPEIWEAQNRGVIFDGAHGLSHFNINVARAAIKAGFLPDIISTDLTRKGLSGISKSLPHIMSKFLSLGMDLESVIACTTCNPAKNIDTKLRIGTLSSGAVADVAILELEKGKFLYRDSQGDEFVGDKCLSPRHTIRSGKPVWQ